MKRRLFLIAAAQAGSVLFSNPSPENDIMGIPEGIRFENEESRENYVAALRGDGLSDVPNPLLVIIGPPGSGKTRLARHFAESQGWEVYFGRMKPAGLLSRTLSNALRYDLPNVVFDDMSTHEIESAFPLLKPSLEMNRNEITRLIGVLPQKDPRRLRIVITCPLGTVFTPDLVRRARFVDLSAPQPQSAAA